MFPSDQLGLCLYGDNAVDGPDDLGQFVEGDFVAFGFGFQEFLITLEKFGQAFEHGIYVVKRHVSQIRKLVVSFFSILIAVRVFDFYDAVLEGEIV